MSNQREIESPMKEEKSNENIISCQRGRKFKPLSELFHAQFNQFSHEIIKNDILMRPSESKIYEKIAQLVGRNTNAQAVYQSAKRYFEKRVPNLKKTQPKKNNDDYIWAVDKYNLQSQKHDHFDIDIDGMYLIKNENGGKKPSSEWVPCFRQIVFAMSRVPCAWSIDRPRNAANEISVNGHCLQRNCSAKIFAFTENGQKLLTIQIANFKDDIQHDKKYLITHNEKSKIIDMLKKDKASVVVIGT